MTTQTRTPTGFTSTAGTNPASTGTQLAAVQTAGDGIYVSVVYNSNTFYCTHAAFTVPSDATINWVRITPIVRGAAAGTCTCVTALYVGGATYAGTAQSVATTTWTTLDFDWPVNPATGAAWTPAAVNALTRMYVQAPDASPDLWVDHVQVTVDYTEAGVGASITPEGATHGHISGVPYVVQSHAVAPSASWHAHSATEPTVILTVGPSGATHAHVAGSPALVQSHALDPADSSHGQVATSPTLAQAVSVSPTPGMHGHTTTTPVVSQSHVMAPAGSVHGHVATTPAVSILLVGGAGLHAHSASIPTVTQAHTVTPAPGICGHTATSPTSTQVASVSPAGATHAHAGTTPTVTQTHTIAPTAGTHSQTATIPTSVVATLIHPEGSSHAHGVTSAAITQAHRIAAHAAGHAHAAGVPTVATRHVITPHGCIHGQTAAPSASGWRDLTIHTGPAGYTRIVSGPAIRRTIHPGRTL